MSKFESYPTASSLSDEDIALYNQNTVTHKVTFGTLFSLIRTKLVALGFVSSVTAGTGLTGGTITSSGTIKCSLKSETTSSLSSLAVSSVANRQYPVTLDKDGYLSVNVPWSTSGEEHMNVSGSNAASHVNFSGAFTVGSRLLPIGTNSVAEGINNTASGSCSHAEGTATKALSDFAHAEGQMTEANGLASHAEGFATYSANYAHSEGYGAGGHSPANNYNDAPNGYVDSNLAIIATESGSHAEGYAKNANTVGVGSIQATGQGAHAEGYSDAVTNYGAYLVASGKGAHAEGYVSDSHSYTVAFGDGSHAEGGNTVATGNYSHAEGIYTQSDNIGTHTEGCGYSALNIGSNTISASLFDSSVNRTIYSGFQGAHAEGCTPYTPSNDINLCGTIQSLAMGSHAEGYANSSDSSAGLIIAKGRGAHAEGYASATDYIIAQNKGSHAEGYNTKATGEYGSHAEGYTTQATGEGSHAEGDRSIASGNSSHSEGTSTRASGGDSHAEGKETQAQGNQSHAEGYQTTASGYQSHAEGRQTNAVGIASHAEGWKTKSNSPSSHTEGLRTYTSGNASHSEGYSSDYEVNIGDNPISSSDYNNTVTYNISSNADGSHSEGYVKAFPSSTEGIYMSGAIQANGLGSHAEGYTDSHYSSAGLIVAKQEGSHAEGYASYGNYILADGKGAHAEGVNTKALANGSHAGGYNAVASLVSQFVQGGDNLKFNESIYDKGVFGIQPDGNYYQTDGQIIQAQNGAGGTVAVDVNIGLQLQNCSIYLLFLAMPNQKAGMYLINSASLASGSPKTTFMGGQQYDVSEQSNNRIILDNVGLLFHLIRII